VDVLNGNLAFVNQPLMLGHYVSLRSPAPKTWWTATSAAA
jgi:hypothetical protein